MVCFCTNSAEPLSLIIQQNSFNLTPDNTEILIIQHLRSIVPKPEVLLFTRKIFINKRNRSQGHVQKGLQSVCTSTVAVSPTPSTSSAMKTPENTEEDPDDPEPADEGGIQM
jgi:hypothetical protein